MNKATLHLANRPSKRLIKELIHIDIEHPDIERIERTGYPEKEYLEYEREEDSSEKDE